MFRKLLFVVAAAALALPASAQLSTTLYSQANGNATSPYATTPAPCATYMPAYGVDQNGNGLCIAFPQVNLTAQTAALTNQLLCSAAACPAGLYQLTVNLVPTTAATAGTMTASVAFTDDAQAQNIPLITGLSLLSKAPSSAVYTLYSTGAAPITLSTSLLGVTGTPAYSFRAQLRRLF